MRKRTLLALMLVAAVLPSGCTQKKDSTPAPADTASPAESEAPAETVASADVDSLPAEVEAEVGDSDAATTLATAPTTPTTATATYFGEVLVSWNAGKQDDAVAQFLSLAWDNSAVLSGIPALSISEEQFASLPEDQRNQITKHAQELVDTLSGLVKKVIAIGQNLAASGDTQGAETHYRAVQQCGQALSAPEHIFLIQAVGRAIAQVAQEELDKQP